MARQEGRDLEVWGVLPLTLVWVECFLMPNVSESMNEEKREGTTGFAVVLAP